MYQTTKNDKTIYFVLAENSCQIPKEINSKDVCIVFTKRQGNISDKFGYSGVFSCIPDVVEFWAKKNIDFIINPFDAKQRGFDENSFSLLLQNEITPVILLDKILTQNKEEQIQILRNLFLLNGLCKKYKLPIIIVSEENNKEINVIYSILGYNENQITNFNKVIFP